MRLSSGFSQFRRLVESAVPEPPPSIGSPATIITSTTLDYWHRSDLDVTNSGSGTCPAWNDQTANDKDWLQAGATSIQPVINTGGPNGLPYLTLDGAARYMTNVFNSPGTGFVWMLLRRNSGSGCFINGSSTSTKRFTIWENTAGTCQMNNSSAGNIANMPTGTWFRLWAHFTGSVADELRVGSAAPVTGTSAGSLAGVGGSWLGCGGALTLFAGFDIIEDFHCPTKPTELAELDAYVTALTAGGVQV